MRKKKTFLGAAFVVAINLPLFVMITKLDPNPLFGRLSPAPTLPTSMREVLSMPGVGRAYFSDHFGLRGSLLRLHANVVPSIFGTSGSSKVVKGEDGWLFLASESVLDDYRKLNPFSEDELDQWATLLQRRARYCESRGVHYLFVVGPNKHTVYGDFLPEHIRQKEGPSRFDQLLDHLGATAPGVDVLDLRQALKGASDHVRTYHRTDTHWNRVGAAVAADRIARALQARGYAVPGFALDFDGMRRAGGMGGDLSRMIGAKLDLLETQLLPKVAVEGKRLWLRDHVDPEVGDIVELEEQSRTGADLRAVVFHDSFGDGLRPYLSTQFQNTAYLWGDAFDPQLVDEFRPDVVIQVLAERRLFNRKPDLEELEAQFGDDLEIARASSREAR